MYVLSHFSHDRLCATPWTAARQASPSMGFSRQEPRSGLPFPAPGDLPDPGVHHLHFLHCRQILYYQATKKAHTGCCLIQIDFCSNKLLKFLIFLRLSFNKTHVISPDSGGFCLVLIKEVQTV